MGISSSGWKPQGNRSPGGPTAPCSFPVKPLPLRCQHLQIRNRKLMNLPSPGELRYHFITILCCSKFTARCINPAGVAQPDARGLYGRGQPVWEFPFSKLATKPALPQLLQRADLNHLEEQAPTPHLFMMRTKRPQAPSPASPGGPLYQQLLLFHRISRPPPHPSRPEDWD